MAAMAQMEAIMADGTSNFNTPLPFTKWTIEIE